MSDWNLKIGGSADEDCRQIMLDTETTGLEPSEGHRIIEIGCVELFNRRLTGKTFHQYLCPDRAVDAEAVAVHGLTDEFLADQPRFGDVVESFLAFIDGAELVIHNAPFDIGFLDNELRLVSSELGGIADRCQVFDSLPFARKLHPGARASLDALCRRYGIDNSHRELHGALLDSQILADVYLAMTGGQSALKLEADDAAAQHALINDGPVERLAGWELPVQLATVGEAEAHGQFLDRIREKSGGSCFWDSVPAS